jgi:hypothetical protein
VNETKTEAGSVGAYRSSARGVPDVPERASAQTRLEELRAAKAARVAEARSADELAEIELLELEERFSASHGRRGKRWDLVRTTAGPIVLVRGDSMLVKQFRGGLDDAAAAGGDAFPVTFAFAVQQVAHPSPDLAGAMFNEMQGLAVRCQDILIALHRGEDSTIAAKP